MNFEGKVVIITGASSGIGAATAEYFAKLGAKLAIVGRNIDNLKIVADKCAQFGNEALIIRADSTVEEDVQGIIDKTIAKYNRIDILINNAGILANGSIENTSLEQYDSIMNTNMRSVYHLTMLAVPYLVKTEGNIVNVSSVAGLRAFPGIVAYAMSKAALDQFTKCVALELAPKKVRVNAVNPGVIVTDIHKRGGMNEKDYEAFLEKCKTTHALGRPGDVDEVSSAIAYLASDCASFITGVLLSVDGGRHAMCPR